MRGLSYFESTGQDAVADNGIAGKLLLAANLVMFFALLGCAAFAVSVGSAGGAILSLALAVALLAMSLT